MRTSRRVMSACVAACRRVFPEGSQRLERCLDGCMEDAGEDAGTTSPVPASYQNRNNSDVVRANAQMKALFGSKYPEVVVHDLYSEVVERCNRDGASMGYPETSDCLFLQDNGVHFSAAGRQFTGIMTAAAVAAYL
mgnify:CR=1 FL=1